MKKMIALIFAVIVIFTFTACGGSGEKEKKGEKVTWPDTEIGNMLPETDASATSVSMSENYISATLAMSRDEYKSYADKCKGKGFTENASMTDNDTYCSYSADSKNGYSLSLSWYESDSSCRLMLSAPEKTDDEEEEPEEEEEKTEKKESKKKKSKKEDDSSESGGVTPEFKEAMDEYEEFFDKYAEFMEGYNNGDGGSLTEYADFMAQYTETMEKLDAIDSDSLSPADEAYYLEVMGRINKRLAEVAY